jgi:hypothetical protein
VFALKFCLLGAVVDVGVCGRDSAFGLMMAVLSNSSMVVVVVHLSSSSSFSSTLFFSLSFSCWKERFKARVYTVVYPVLGLEKIQEKGLKEKVCSRFGRSPAHCSVLSFELHLGLELLPTISKINSGKVAERRRHVQHLLSTGT